MFNIVSNDHGKRDFCVSVGKTNVTDHHTSDTINDFRDSVLVVKCTTATVRYTKILIISLPSQHAFPSTIKQCKRETIAMVRLYENKPLQNAFKSN